MLRGWVRHLPHMRGTRPRSTHRGLWGAKRRMGAPSPHTLKSGRFRALWHGGLCHRLGHLSLTAVSGTEPPVFHPSSCSTQGPKHQGSCHPWAVLSSWLWPGLAVATVATGILGVNQGMRDFSLCLSLSVTLLFKYIKFREKIGGGQVSGDAVQLPGTQHVTGLDSWLHVQPQLPGGGR